MKKETVYLPSIYDPKKVQEGLKEILYLVAQIEESKKDDNPCSTLANEMLSCLQGQMERS